MATNTARTHEQPDIPEMIANLNGLDRPSDQHLVNKLARLLYGINGYHVRRGYRFDQATHPQETAAFEQATVALNFVREMDTHGRIPDATLNLLRDMAAAVRAQNSCSPRLGALIRKAEALL